MIKIKKGSNELTVSPSTYATMFKRLGYEIVNENKKATSKSPEKAKKEESVKEEKIEIDSNKDDILDIDSMLKKATK